MKLFVESPSRDRLAMKAGSLLHVIATYARCGERRAANNASETVLLRDVRDAETGELLADHMWFNRGRLWRSLDLRAGDRVEFYSRAIEYRTGYWGPNRVRQQEAPARRDYRLTPPAGLTVVADDVCGAVAEVA